MSDIASNKRIALNTVILYVKLIISIVVSFIVSRLVLQALGASDYGLYNVVGGVVAMLNTFSASMIATSYRYMAVELGMKDKGNPNKIYNTIFVIHLFLAALLLVFGETLGVFYINHYLNIPFERLSDALFVLHLSLLTTAFAVVAVPMNGLIIAKEKFLFTSLVMIIESALKLVLILLLVNVSGNHLRIYAIIMAGLQLINPIAFYVYCRLKYYDIVFWKFNSQWNDYKDILRFTLWMFIGATAVMGQVQGSAIVINYFFGTVLNAAFGLANQVKSAVSQFTITLRQAFIPQIMKNQITNQDRSLNLVYLISRYSYLTMNIIVIPLLLQMKQLLVIWLEHPPKYTEIFVDFMLISGMIANLSAGFDASIQATGKIKKNQIGYSLINLSLIPLMFFFYKMGMPPYMNVIIMVGLSLITLLFQCMIMKELTAFSISEYIKITIKPSMVSTIAAILPLVCFKQMFVTSSIIDTLSFVVLGIIWTAIAVLLFGLKREERIIILKVWDKIINRIKL